MKSFKNAKRVLTLKLVHRAKSLKNMKLAFDLKLLKKAIRLLKEKQRRLVRRTGLRLLLATQKKVRFERKWKHMMTIEDKARRLAGLPTLSEVVLLSKVANPIAAGLPTPGPAPATQEEGEVEQGRGGCGERDGDGAEEIQEGEGGGGGGCGSRKSSRRSRRGRQL